MRKPLLSPRIALPGEPRIILLAVLILAACLTSFTAHAEEPDLSRIRLPSGFSIELFARVPNAREMALGKSTLFVGTRRRGEVYALELLDGGRSAGKLHRLVSGLDMPSGVAFRDGSLYVAAVSKILRYDDVEAHLADPPVPATLPVDLPSETHHGWKFIAFGPDGKLYVPVGAPCNICDAGDPFATIMRMNPDGSDLEIFARGIRNTVGFDWRPGTDELWFTENGRDWLGDDAPSDELNRAEKPGLHFGYPYCHAGTIVDPEYGAGHDCADYVPPVRRLGPHVASLGMTFYRGDQFPLDYRGDVFIAEHGSWNRSTPIGYRVTRVSLDGAGAPTYEVFAEGWLDGGARWGRPADVFEMPDGSLLVSDDKFGAIYRISYRK